MWKIELLKIFGIVIFILIVRYFINKDDDNSGDNSTGFFGSTT